MQPIIQASALNTIKEEGHLILIDARSGPDAKEKYNSLHLEKALYVDMDNDLAAKNPNPAVGGRHPLPAINSFSQLLGRLGIKKDSHVIVYDDKGGANAAARFWWMLAAVGHDKVQVLDGGIAAAISESYPTGAGDEAVIPAEAYPVTEWQLPMATIEEVERVVQDPAFLVIDVRDNERYTGKKEPIDTIAGHIPGAINIPLTENLTPDGLFLSAEELKEKYTTAIGNRDQSNVIVHCGSGVTACHTLLAMTQAGIPTPKLYVGSWSEWSRTGRTIGKDQE